jgi:putative FmdB family regulatory protein
MALYLYKCSKCGNEYEKIQNMNSLPDSECLKCNGKVEKILFPSSLHFKGSGWYETDYATKSKTGE